MNNRTEKTVIKVEKFQRTVVRMRRNARIVWCDRCATETIMLAPDEAAARLQTTAREIFRLTQNGAIHYLETTCGVLLVCGNSLSALAQE